MQTNGDAQVFARTEIGFQPELVAKEQEIVGAVLAPQRLAAPAQFAGAYMQQAREHAQQRRLAAAVGTLDQRQFTGTQLKVQWREHGFVLAQEAHGPRFEQGRDGIGGGHFHDCLQWRGACPFHQMPQAQTGSVRRAAGACPRPWT
jgi:hypothetical protein